MAERSLLVDLRVAQVHRERGISRYCQSLILALARERPDINIACLIDIERDPPTLIDEVAAHSEILTETRAVATHRPSPSHYLQMGLFQTDRTTVPGVFPLELARHRPRLGAIVYDMIPWLFPEDYLPHPKAVQHYLRILSAVRHLDRVFAISESVRRDTIAIANADPSRVTTIYGGIDEHRWSGLSVDDEAVGTDGRERNFRSGKLEVTNANGERFPISAPFWLYVAGDDVRKNLPRLLEALAQIKRQEAGLTIPLVVACSMEQHRRTELLARASSMGLKPGFDVTFTGYVSNQMLARLYRHCLATVFPSLYEGLGLPVLESYVFNKPVLASDAASFRELVPPGCRFDPYSVRSIADALRGLRDNPEVSEESLAFGLRAVELCRWPNAARHVGDWVTMEPLGQGPSPSGALWVASPLPPARSGVASYMQRTLGAPEKPVVFFMPSRQHAELEAARTALGRTRQAEQAESAQVEVLGLSTLQVARQAAPDQSVLYVLGNSEHHLDTFATLIEQGAGPKDAVLMHDVFLGGLLVLYFGSDERVMAAMAPHYGGEAVATWLQSKVRHVGSDDAPHGARLLVRDAGVRHFIVNSEAAARRLVRDLNSDATDLRIDVAFLPFLKPMVNPRRQGSGPLRVGHFGMLNPSKKPELLVAACDILAAQQPLELLFVGYGVRSYLSEQRLIRSYVQTHDSPSDVELESTMATVDCAVQLRFQEHGESSGVVHQLLALRRPVICTKAGAFEELRDLVEFVDVTVAPAELAEAINVAVKAPRSAGTDALIAQRSPRMLEDRLRRFLGFDDTG